MSNNFEIKRYPTDFDHISVSLIPAFSFPIHWHSYYEFELVVSGKGTQVINGTEYSYKTGDAFLLGPADFHKRTLDEQAEIWLIQIPIWLIPLAFSGDFYMNNLPTVTHLSSKEMDVATSLLKLLSTYCDSNDNLKISATDSILTTLFLYIFDFEKKSVKKNHTERISIIYHYLQEHFSESISLKDLSKKFNLSEKYLCAYYKKHTGRTIIDTLREMRLFHASQLIISSNETVQQISFKCGYNSVSFFLRDFKNKFVMTPTQMRKARNTIQS